MRDYIQSDYKLSSMSGGDLISWTEGPRPWTESPRALILTEESAETAETAENNKRVTRRALRARRFNCACGDRFFELEGVGLARPQSRKLPLGLGGLTSPSPLYQEHDIINVALICYL